MEQRAVVETGISVVVVGLETFRVVALETLV